MNVPRIVVLRDPARPEPAAIEAAAGALRRGELIILPTDTVYGVAADPRRPDAEQRLFQLKRRDAGKPIALLAAAREQVELQHGAFSDLERALAERFWPGALTLVLSVGQGFEGFRVPNHPVALAVIRAAGHPLRVSSANLSGRSPALTAAEALAALGGAVALALDAGPAPGARPSTVVKIEANRYAILRGGAVEPAEIAAALQTAGWRPT